MTSDNVPKKSSENTEYAEAARSFLKAKRKELGGGRELYRLLYGREPSDSENQTLINLLSRGNLSAEFLGLCTDKLGLHNVTLSELFGTKRL
ncbi:hypothetical protein [Vibrio sp. H11]|uniref:hypothetical protein n=1 Tax=Vibrio sp. H11 TaxID=2565928 RepID=UPI0010A5FCCB|nr:hypothetical protein [Vibrio sp. H11]